MPKPPSLSPAKKITREVLRNNPLLAQLIRERLKEIKAARQARRDSELPFPEDES